jgi:KAP family P-loop domain
MSIQIIEDQIKKFLADDTPGVLAICGKWGVGKTYFWNKTIRELSASEETFKLPKYGYVSLFGIVSLAGLKSEIFTAITDREMIGKGLDVQSLQENTLSAVKSAVRKLPKLAELVLPNSSSVAESVCFASIQNAVICIDDLERKSKDLELKDVLGLASLLKEQKNCKVVLLLNDGETGLEDFKKYHEKVVDSQLRFEPTAEDCVEIALPDDTDEIKILREYICKLNITNIRTIKKIERVVNMAIPLLKEFSPAIMYQAISSLVLFGCCHYRADDEKIPTLEHVTKSGFARMGFGNDTNTPPQEQDWNALLQQCGYTHSDEFDLELLKGITNGYIVDSELQDAAAKKNAAIEAAKSTGSFHDAWDVYHHNLNKDEKDVIDTLCKSFEANVTNISPANLSGLLWLLRHLDEDTKADEVIETYIDARQPSDPVFDLGTYAFAHDITDEKMRERFAEVHTSSLKKESLKELLARITENNSWNMSDEIALSEIDEEEYYDLFITEEGPHLANYINRCLRFGRSSNPKEHEMLIAAKATKALKRIGQGSKINQLRLKAYDITFEDETTS